MSLIAAIPAKDGIVLASDTMFNLGQYRQSAPQIHQLNARVCWTAVGEYSLIQRVGALYGAFQESNQSLRELSLQLAGVIKACVRDLLGVDFRTEIYAQNMGAIAQLHRADFLFAEWTNSPVLLHLSVVGSPEWIIDRPYLLGSGDAFAGVILNKYKDLTFTVQSASVLAYRIVEETMDTGIFGLGGPLDVWQLNDAGPKKLTESEVEKVKDTVQTVRKHEIAVFEKHLMATVSH